jgi:hypothetical protein
MGDQPVLPDSSMLCSLLVACGFEAICHRPFILELIERRLVKLAQR